MMLPHDYNHLSPEAAIQLQQQLREQLQLIPLSQSINTIGGADISFNKFSEIVYAGIVIFSYPQLNVLRKASAITTVSFPYIPGLLAFREIPALMDVWNQLPFKPDVLILDGHGIAHPRRMGIATHFGIIAGTPTIGCAKSLLTGKFHQLGNDPGDTVALIQKNEQIGEVLRTKRNCKPVFVSPGNLITQEESLQIIKNCVRKYRIPEPTRLAHIYVNDIRTKSRENKNENQ